MTNTRYVALLRGINVGGNNIIKMSDLKVYFERMGFSDVATYIQSGNVLFSTEKQDTAKLTQQIEQVLSETFSYASSVVVISHAQLTKVVEDAPDGFGEDPTAYRYDVLFLKNPLTASEAMKQISIREGVDTAYVGKDVIYFSRLISKATQSYLNNIIKLPIYKQMTIRNWNTTTTLLTKLIEI